MKEFRVKEVCRSCSGTGLFSGMGEGPGVAVVCHTCNGTGCHEFTHSYEEFVERKERSGIKWVIETNPGIGIGENAFIKYKDFGGMSYDDWKNGRKFVQGMEMRNYTCPAWWYQSANYKLKPDWDECMSSLGGYISNCKFFKDKEKCWVRFDRERANQKEIK